MTRAPVARERCSVLANAAGDPQEGTAPPGDRWFLAEHLGPWSPHAVPEADVAPQVVRAVNLWARDNNGRVQVIRRTGRATRRVPPVRWYRVDSRPGHESIHTGVCDTPEDLVSALDEPGEPHRRPLNLVCVHGRHDACCAIRGRPLVAALNAADPDRTWECSHLGGCRFSPSLVLLPHGFIFGGVPPAEAAALVARYDSGLLDPRWLRGRVVFPPVVQAAQHHARELTGALGVDALPPVVTTALDGGRTRVVFTDPDCAVTLAERRVDAGRPLTCAASRAGWMRVFDLVAAQPA